MRLSVYVPVLDFTSHGHESLLHIGCILGTRLKERDAYLICEGLSVAFEHAYLCCLGVHHLFRRQITFVAHEQLVDILICISVNLIQPLFDIVETLLISDIVHNLQVIFNVKEPEAI